MAAHDKDDLSPPHEGRFTMAPCHIPEFRSPAYEQAFNELWALACRGQVSVEQVRQEMLRLRRQFAIGAREIDPGMFASRTYRVPSAASVLPQRRGDFSPGACRA
jgi:hypothetical protein